MVYRSLSLSEVRGKGRIGKFIAREEALGVGRAKTKNFERLSEALIMGIIPFKEEGPA